MNERLSASFTIGGTLYRAKELVAEESVDEQGIRELVKKIIAGDVELFEIIVENYQGEIYRIAWRLTHNYDDASDVVQETFLRMYRALWSWRGKAQFSTWVYRIAVNTALDYLRRQAKHYRGRVYADETAEETSGYRQRLQGIEYNVPSNGAQSTHQRELIHKLLLRLSPMQRKCFLLHYFQELSIQEVSKILRCSVGSVKRHIFRAKLRLKKLLKEKELWNEKNI